MIYFLKNNSQIYFILLILLCNAIPNIDRSLQQNLLELESGSIRWDITKLLQRGIYEILNMETDFAYYGHSSNLVKRMADHSYHLNRGEDHNVKLQAAF